ncbi:hypothetical protein HNP84_001888 [Thermocatellispora tengchongensis]|uniref:Uncharacterized protein n=1 Tax=Thermocatellispora tengchongensis TaxID=1073253 RepID=A0A840P838_9ACTN|nr:hypothetical protein [Thermocatellispora tengchongensis]MBB5132175.1 hypothetical protein [Thermocatellispora tengchongensis]
MRQRAPVNRGVRPAVPDGVRDAEERQGMDAVGTVPMVILVAATMWVMGVTVATMVLRRRRRSGDEPDL